MRKGIYDHKSRTKKQQTNTNPLALGRKSGEAYVGQRRDGSINIYEQKSRENNAAGI